MKHIETYREISLWTKELIGATSHVLVAINRDFFNDKNLEKDISLILKDTERIFAGFSLNIIGLTSDNSNKWRFNYYLLDGIINKDDIESYLKLYDRTKMACIRISIIGPEEEIEIGDGLYLSWDRQGGLAKLG